MLKLTRTVAMRFSSAAAGENAARLRHMKSHKENDFDDTENSIDIS